MPSVWNLRTLRRAATVLYPCIRENTPSPKWRGAGAGSRGMIFIALESQTLAQRFTDEMDRNYRAGDRPARYRRHFLDHRLATFYRPPSPPAKRAQVRGKPDASGPRPISGGKPR